MSTTDDAPDRPRCEECDGRVVSAIGRYGDDTLCSNCIALETGRGGYRPRLGDG